MRRVEREVDFTSRYQADCLPWLFRVLREGFIVLPSVPTQAELVRLLGQALLQFKPAGNDPDRCRCPATPRQPPETITG